MARALVPVMIVGWLLAHPGASTVAAGPTEPDLDGLYICSGVNPGGEAYRGLVEIVRQNETFQLRWTFSPEETALGIGILRDGVLAVSYYGQTPGVVIYRVQDDHTLIGTWTVLGAQGAVFSETLAKLPGSVQRPAPRVRRPAGRSV